MINNIHKTTLENGIRIVSEYIPYVESVSVGVWVRSGSRDESGSACGISHFIEHMVFKGTQGRSAKQIAVETDSIGCDLNAFTDKEFTCFYTKVLSEYLPNVIDVLSDMLGSSVFSETDIEHEKNVVIEEINQIESVPEDIVHDMAFSSFFGENTLAHPVIGSADLVREFTRDDILRRIKQYYCADNIVISAAGKIEHCKLVDVVESFFGCFGGKSRTRRFDVFSPRAESVTASRDISQIHFCLSARGVSETSEDKYALAVLDTALGGSMSSRLFQELREDRGLAYTVESYSSAFEDCGMFTIYAGVAAEKFGDALELCKKCCAEITENALTEEEILRAKNQLRGSLLLGMENTSSHMSQHAKCELYGEDDIPIEAIIDKALAVSSEDIVNLSKKIFSGDFALAAIGNVPF